MPRLFNSTFEISLRVLLLLDAVRTKGATIDRIAAYDFITTYGSEFGVSSESLHGSNRYNFSELAEKRMQCTAAVKDLVLDGFVSVSRTHSGFLYRITDLGVKYANELSSVYASEYLHTAKKTHRRYKNQSDTSLTEYINEKALHSLRRQIDA